MFRSIQRAARTVGPAASTLRPDRRHDGPADPLSTTTPRQAAAPQTTERTALQKHVGFFDRDGDGIITLGDTAHGMQRLGQGPIAAWGSALLINGGLGWSSGSPWYAPFQVKIDGIHLGKHDSDTDAFDTDGRFHSQALDDVFTQYDANGDGMWTRADLDQMLEERAESFVGSLASKAEWNVLFDLAGETHDVGGEAQKVLTRERIEGLFDGTLFYKMVGERPPFAGR